MNCNQIFEALAAESGKNAKLDILNAHKDNDLFKEVCRLALDPLTLFYIKKIPTYQTMPVSTCSLEDAVTLIVAELSTRKMTGNRAITFLSNILGELKKDDAKVIERIILKDLRCGVDTAVNKVWPNLVMEYPCMLATAYDQKLIDKFQFPGYVQLKLDGMRFNAIVKDGVCQFRSRQGKVIEIADPTLGDLFVSMGEGVYDGELLCRKDDGTVMDRATGNGIINKAVKGTQSPAEGRSVCAVLWDFIPLSGFSKGVYNVDYVHRLNVIQDAVGTLPPQFRIEVVHTDTVANIDEAQEIFQKFLDEGLEGIILKSTKMIWKNARSKDQIKFKGEEDCDLLITDWIEGNGKYVGMLGKLRCQSSDGKVVVDVGIGDKTTNIMTDEFRANTKPADVIGKIAAVKYNVRIKKRNSDIDSLFLPRLLEIREDKTVADASGKIK